MELRGRDFMGEFQHLLAQHEITHALASKEHSHSDSETDGPDYEADAAQVLGGWRGEGLGSTTTLRGDGLLHVQGEGHGLLCWNPVIRFVIKMCLSF